MTRQEYVDWVRKLGHCAKVRRVTWPSREMAEQAVPWMVENSRVAGLPTPNPGAYECTYKGGCGGFHISRNVGNRQPREDDKRPARVRDNNPRGGDRLRDRRKQRRRR